MTFAEAKLLSPHMRRKQPVGLTGKSLARATLNCCLCGANHTYTSGSRKPKHATEFMEYHNAGRCQVLSAKGVNSDR